PAEADAGADLSDSREPITEAAAENHSRHQAHRSVLGCTQGPRVRADRRDRQGVESPVVRLPLRSVFGIPLKGARYSLKRNGASETIQSREPAGCAPADRVRARRHTNPFSP